MASIQVIQGRDRKASFELGGGENVIGRQASPVELSDNTVSRQHARVTFRNGVWILEDMGAANGTYLNGLKMTRPMVLNRGDQIRCGSTLLVFADGQGAPMPALDVDENGGLVDAAIVATIPSNEDSVIIPTPEAGARAIDTLRILYELIAEVGSIFNIDVLLQRTLDKILSVLKADRGYIILIDEAGELTLKASGAAEDSPSKEVPVSRTIINEVVARQVGVLSSNAMSDKRFASGKSVQDLAIRSAICVPLKGRQRILGVIHVDCGVSKHTYTTEQLRLLTAIGYQTGLALDSVALYEAAVQSERLAAVGETVALLSHHIKNILQALSAGIDLVQMGLYSQDMAKAKNAWPIVQRNLERINFLILNMLAFSKDRDPLLENINANHVLTECVELESHRADEHGVALMTDLNDLPPIPADSAGLQQAFLNLITNALDAVEDDVGVVTVTSEYDQATSSVIVKVIDNGKGIESGQIKRIFTPFFSSKGHRGTGLGLAVARKVVREHHGRIRVQSRPGEGATFTIYLSAVRSTGGDAGDTAVPPTQ